MMRGIIVYEEKDAAYNQSFIDYMITEGRKMDMELSLVIYEKVRFGIGESGYFVEYEGKTVEDVDFVIYRCRKYLLSRQFESMGIPVFNSSKVCEICNDKALTYQYIAGLKIPMVPSMFVENEQMVSVIKSQKEDVVVKTVSGHGGSQVCLVRNGDEASLQEAVKIVGNERVVIQPLVKGRGQDLRVYVIGGKVVAAVLRSAVSGFKANFSLGGSVSLYELSEEERSLVEKIMSKISLDYAGIDFIIGEQGELIFNEIEDVVGARMLYQCSDIDVIPIYFNHIRKCVNDIRVNNK